jgi:hypothetical protein
LGRHEEHLRNLQLICQRISEANLKLNPNKCEFLKRKVKYVGHVVSEKGIEIDQGKTDKAVNWPIPTTPEDVRRCLGFVGYYRRFIHNFSKISRPLTDLIPAPNKKKKSKSTATRE